ncbi:MAG: hypothetical protein ABFS24_05515 [Pseudomonadota bacterium]
MKPFRICLFAALSLAASAPGTALSTTITASQLLDKAHAPGFDFSSDGSAFKNVLGTPDDGGRYLDLAWAATSQTYIELMFAQDIGMDGTSSRDIKIVNLATDANNSNQAAAVWIEVDGMFYNVGSHEIIRDVANGVAGVWDDPKGEGTTYRDRGWVVYGGTRGGKIDLDFFFGPDGIYGTVVNPHFGSIILSGFNLNGQTTENYDLDSIKAFTLAGAIVPVPPAVWLFTSGLIGLIAVGRKRYT